MRHSRICGGVWLDAGTAIVASWDPFLTFVTGFHMGNGSSRNEGKATGRDTLHYIIILKCRRFLCIHVQFVKAHRRHGIHNATWIARHNLDFDSNPDPTTLGFMWKSPLSIRSKSVGNARSSLCALKAIHELIRAIESSGKGKDNLLFGIF